MMSTNEVLLNKMNHKLSFILSILSKSSLVGDVTDEDIKKLEDEQQELKALVDANEKTNDEFVNLAKNEENQLELILLLQKIIKCEMSNDDNLTDEDIKNMVLYNDEIMSHLLIEFDESYPYFENVKTKIASYKEEDKGFDDVPTPKSSDKIVLKFNEESKSDFDDEDVKNYDKEGN